MKKLKQIQSISFKNISYRYLFFLVFAIAIFPFHFFAIPESGIDGSWALSINLAIKNNFIWGKDYLFSYGPLGYLATRIKEYVPIYHIIIFQLLVWINLCFIQFKVTNLFINFEKKHFFLGLLLTACIYNYIQPELSSFLLLSFVFWIIEALINDKINSAIIALFISLFMFFIKLDSGIIILFFLLLFYLHQLVTNKNRYQYIILLVLHITLILLLSKVLKVDLPNYLASSVHVIGSYNDAMYLENSTLKIVVGICVLIVFVLYSLTNLKIIFSKSAYALSYFICMCVLFILFKHGFVRHQGYGFLYPPLTLILAIFLIHFFTPTELKLFKLLYLILIPSSIIISSLLFIENIDITRPFLFNVKNKTLNFISLKLYHKRYVSPERKATGIDKANSSIILPKKIKDEIGKSTTDIVPHIVSMIYDNKLNYNPRPGIQTYANYDAYLDEKGYTKYTSQNKPEYIIYCAENYNNDASIDNRYPFFDETRTKIAMLENYTIIDSFENQLILKSGNRNPLIYSNSRPLTYKLNTEFEIEKSKDLVLMKFDLSYSNLGKIIRFFYQPPSLKVRFTLDDGKQYTFKIIIGLLSEGVIVNKFLLTNKQVTQLYKKELNTIPDIKKIEIIGNDWGFIKEIKSSSVIVKMK
jgi:hypothetical protein